jgi:predicted dehydrogenase
VRLVTDRNRVEEWSVPDRPTVVAALEAFVNALRTGAAMPITGLDGLRAVELADACYASAAAGNPVRLNS